MTRHVRRLQDPKKLAVITHPLRLRLYEALVSYGPSTASRLAHYVPAAPGSLSYHLRQLADAGFIEAANDLRQDSRERWWRAIPGGAQWSAEDFPEGPGTEEALAAAERVLTDRQFERLRQWQLEGKRQWGSVWEQAAVSTDTLLRMTPEDMHDFTEDVAALIKKWAARSRRVRQETPESELADSAEVFVFLHAFPFAPPTAPPEQKHRRTNSPEEAP